MKKVSRPNPLRTASLTANTVACALVVTLLLGLPLNEAMGQVLVFNPKTASQEEKKSNVEAAVWVAPKQTEANSDDSHNNNHYKFNTSSAVFATPTHAYEQEKQPTYTLQSQSHYIRQPVYNAPQSSSNVPGTIRLVDAVEPFPQPGATPNQPAKPFSFDGWDPFSSGGGSSGSSWFGNVDNSEYYNQFQDISKKVARRFVEKVSLDYTFIPRGNKSDGFGINEVAYQTEFSFPCRLMHDHEPLYLVPGIDLVWWDGPSGPPYHKRNMPPNAFGAYLEFGTAPRYSKDFAFELWVRGGVYSDFNKITTDALRLSGNGSVLIGLTPEVEGVLGVVYVNRNNVKILPRIGVIWKPNEKVTWKLVFPDPKLSRELTRINNVDWKFYIQGNYGGGSWEIRDSANGETLRMDYNDIRVGAGLEFTNNAFVNGYFEFGGAFGREIYARHEAWCEPQDTIYLKAGFYF